MPIEPIKIPQNVHIEDRIVGPLTLKQILIVGIGAGFSYTLYGMMTQAYGALPLGLTVMVWIPAGIAAIFAFIRINDVSMFRLMLLAIEKLNKPSTRVWSPRRGITINIRTFTAPESIKQHQAAEEKAGMQGLPLDELSTILDRPMNTQKEDEPSTLSPLEEEIETDELEIRRPVDPSRVTVNTVAGSSMDTVSAPLTGSISLFRDLSPHA
jgi:hypothetical protein